MSNNIIENPITKTTLLPQGKTPEKINLSDIPDFLYPENTNSELYIYLTQKINWPYYSLQDIYQKLNPKTFFNDWVKEIMTLDSEKK